MMQAKVAVVNPTRTVGGSVWLVGVIYDGQLHARFNGLLAHYCFAYMQLHTAELHRCLVHDVSL